MQAVQPGGKLPLIRGPAPLDIHHCALVTAPIFCFGEGSVWLGSPMNKDTLQGDICRWGDDCLGIRYGSTLLRIHFLGRHSTGGETPVWELCCEYTCVGELFRNDNRNVTDMLDAVTELTHLPLSRCLCLVQAAVPSRRFLGNLLPALCPSIA